MANLSILSGIKTLREGAAATKVSIDDYANVIMDFDRRTATERSDNEARLEAKPKLAALFEADPEAEFDPREVVQRVGLKNCQADRAFAMYQIKQARITYQSQHQAAAAD